MRITNILTENAGRYNCTAKNLYGKATKTAELIVRFNDHYIINSNGNELLCNNGTCVTEPPDCDGLNCTENNEGLNCKCRSNEKCFLKGGNFDLEITIFFN